MATIKFYVKDKKSKNATIYLRLSIKRGSVFTRKINKHINPIDWNFKTNKVKSGDGVRKKLQKDLNKYSEFISNKLNEEKNKRNIDSKWLKYQIGIYEGVIIEENKISNNLIDCFNLYIEKAPTIKNSKRGRGLSENRIKDIKSTKKIVENYKEARKKITIQVKDINPFFADDFLKFLEKECYYSTNYSQKVIENIKTICKYVNKNYDTPISSKLTYIETIKHNTDIKPAYLTFNEQQKIKNLKVLSKGLINARKWLILGCNIGQRGGDLLNITSNNIHHENNIYVIKLTQEKTNKKVTIPFNNEIEEIVSNGLPYKISNSKFNEYIKELCRLAEINEQIEGTKTCLLDENNEIIQKDKNGNYTKKNGKRRKIKGTYPKYELITSHSLRRSYCSNYYRNIPTPLLMQITAHGTEKTFLKYIGVTNSDYAKEVSILYDKLPSIQDNNLKVVKNLKKVD